MIEADLQKFSADGLVSLYDLDLTLLGGTVHYFIPAADGVTVVSWKGNEYTPRPMKVEGYSRPGTGQLPTPKFTIAAGDTALALLVAAHNNLKGAKLTRWQTFETYLDNGASPDPNQHFPPDIYFVERKSAHSRLGFEFELKSAVDLEGKKIPARLILRDFCPLVYRIWDADAGQWKNINTDPKTFTCPYVGSTMFDVNNTPTPNKSADSCSHKLTGCNARFGNGQELPFGGFPGVSQGRFG